MITNILIVEDETLLGESVVQYFENTEVKCILTDTFNKAVNKINEKIYDCIIIDIGLPDGSGIDLIKYIKVKKIDSSLIIISARNSLEDKLDGFTVGADDFLVKPFHLSELNARINALIRRKRFEGKEILEYQEISIKLETRNVHVKGKKIILTKKEFDLLVYFIANSDRILTKDAIAYNLWDSNADLAVSSEIIYTHIKNLRKKLVEAGCKDYVHGVYGIGYKFGE